MREIYNIMRWVRNFSESIACQIHPSYKEQYVDVAAMMSMPGLQPFLIPQSQPNVCSWESRRSFSKQCKQDSKADPRKTGARQQANHPVMTLRNRSKAGRSKAWREASEAKQEGSSLGEAKSADTRPKKRKKEGATDPGQTTNGSWQTRYRNWDLSNLTSHFGHDAGCCEIVRDFVRAM